MTTKKLTIYDDGFHLEMATDMDDEDIIALQNEIEQNDEADMGQLENPESTPHLPKSSRKS
jgi:hypothetical protein